MMYTNEQIALLKADVKDNVTKWAIHKMDQLCEGRPSLKTASPYLKRGVKNFIARSGEKIEHITDSLLMFVTDEQGNIDTDIIINDLVEMFKLMEVHQERIGSLLVEYGNGEITVNIPHNPFMDMIFGELGQVKITAEDILEIKDMFSTNNTME